MDSHRILLLFALQLATRTNTFTFLNGKPIRPHHYHQPLFSSSPFIWCRWFCIENEIIHRSRSRNFNLCRENQFCSWSYVHCNRLQTLKWKNTANDNAWRWWWWCLQRIDMTSMANEASSQNLLHSAHTRCSGRNNSYSALRFFFSASRFFHFRKSETKKK